jgi:hypothetical protein
MKSDDYFDIIYGLRVTVKRNENNNIENKDFKNKSDYSNICWKNKEELNWEHLPLGL